MNVCIACGLVDRYYVYNVEFNGGIRLMPSSRSVHILYLCKGCLISYRSIRHITAEKVCVTLRNRVKVIRELRLLFHSLTPKVILLSKYFHEQRHPLLESHLESLILSYILRAYIQDE